MEPNLDPETTEIAFAEKKSAATSSTSIAKEHIEAASSLSPSTKSLHQGLSFKQIPATETTTMTKSWHLDVIMEILIRLPVSSIIKCMCVCKQWKSFITSHDFISLHRSYKLNTTPPNILIWHSSWYSNAECFTVHCDNESACLLQTFSSPFNLEKRDHHYIKFVGAIHGLICLAMTINFDSFIWNPSIKRYLKLPELDVSRREDICDTYRVVGFGFDSLNNDYKVLKIFFIRRRRGTNCLQVKIYTLKEQSWRELDPGKVMPYVIESWASSCFTNGSVHWIAQEQTNNLARTCILSFHTNYECFNRFELPSDVLEASLVFLCVSETKGLLSIFRWDESFKFCDIWVKKEYSRDSLWTKIYNINFDFVDQLLFSVFKLRENGEILIMKSKDNPVNGIYALASYDPITQGIKAFEVEINSCPEYGGTHIESLLLLNGCSRMISYVEPQIESADWEKK